MFRRIRAANRLVYILDGGVIELDPELAELAELRSGRATGTFPDITIERATSALCVPAGEPADPQLEYDTSSRTRYISRNPGPRRSRVRRTISTASRCRLAVLPPQRSVRSLVRSTANWFSR